MRRWLHVLLLTDRQAEAHTDTLPAIADTGFPCNSFQTTQPIIMHGSHIQIPSEISEDMGEEVLGW